MHVIGLDIGGAHLKGASNSGECCSELFEIWRAPELLTDRLRQLLARFPPADRLAVAMTAELADCFATRASGVQFIVDSAEQASAGIPVEFWSTEGGWLSPVEARQRPLEVAAANWHALATWAGRLAPQGGALLIDIGSTTTDIIPLWNGLPCPAARTDPGRLSSGELVYSGVRRTPLCAVAQEVLLHDRRCPVAAELFATTLDVYLLLGKILPNEEDRDTANGRPATIPAACDRLARMLCSDRDELTQDDLRQIAESFALSQRDRIADALQTVLARIARLDAILFSGSGDFLARDLIQERFATSSTRHISLSEQFSPSLAEAACAYAAAVLAAEARSA
ncbi:MAG: hydantoinase/oxoprolinase family protein [Planctomycetales bacterium]